MGYSLPPTQHDPDSPFTGPSPFEPEPDKRPRQRRIAKRLALIAAAVFLTFVALLIWAALSPAPAVVVPAPAPSAVAVAPMPTLPMPDVPPAPANVFGDGTFDVGYGSGQLAPGRYHSDGDAQLAYWARLRDTTGDSSAIIANGIAKGPTTITIKSTDAAVKFSGGASWQRVS